MDLADVKHELLADLEKLSDAEVMNLLDSLGIDYEKVVPNGPEPSSLLNNVAAKRLRRLVQGIQSRM